MLQAIETTKQAANDNAPKSFQYRILRQNRKKDSCWFLRNNSFLFWLTLSISVIDASLVHCCCSFAWKKWPVGHWLPNNKNLFWDTQSASEVQWQEWILNWGRYWGHRQKCPHRNKNYWDGENREKLGMQNSDWQTNFGPVRNVKAIAGTLCAPVPGNGTSCNSQGAAVSSLGPSNSVHVDPQV